jgi:hypothetical protein
MPRYPDLFRIANAAPDINPAALFDSKEVGSHLELHTDSVVGRPNSCYDNCTYLCGPRPTGNLVVRGFMVLLLRYYIHPLSYFSGNIRANMAFEE